MRILFLTQWFDPEPTPKGLLFVKKLRDLGHKIEVISPIPNYPYGEFYKGYKFKLIQHEIIDGIRVTRVPIFPSHDDSSFRRALTYLSFTLSSLIAGIFLFRKIDVIYAYHPPNVGFIAIIIGFIKRIPVVHDVQDLWPETFYSTGMIRKKIVIQILNFFSSWVYKRVNSLVVISPGFRNALIERGIPKEKINVVYNWCEESKILMPDQIENNPIEESKNFNIVFAGNMGKAQNLIFVLKAAKVLVDESPNIHFYFVGDGLELDELKNYAINHDLNNVTFLPRVPMTSVGSILMEADALLVHLKPDPLFKITIPSKIQAYMAIGKPIINTINGDASDLITDSNAGINVDPDDLQDLVITCKKMSHMNNDELSEFTKNGRSYYQNNFSLMKGSENLEKIFQTVILKS